ncbi:DoxX family protein [Maricaulis parjimensis]|uniref:DoxX family protein n=1 Tax=Maricaulis parjimensis TaxID=144023 RepID=UPI00193A39DB|nr:DoxX family protein [Maricaulis parjimensis]
MRWLHIGLTGLLALFMVFMGAQKFGGANPVFQYIAEQSGIGLFEPVIRMATGAAEILAAVLLVAGLFVAAVRSCGGMLSAAIIGGAIVFHLSPWLGISAPVAFDAEGNYVHSPMLFGMAVVFFLISLAVIWLTRKTGSQKPAA